MRKTLLTGLLLILLCFSFSSLFIGNGFSQPDTAASLIPPDNPSATGWSQDILAVSTGASNELPASTVYNGLLYLVWQSNTQGVDQLYLKTFDGNTWSQASTLTVTQESCGGARLVVYQNLLYLFFHSGTVDSQRDIYYMTSDGNHWSTAKPAVQHEGSDDFCGVAVYDGKLYLAWTTDRTGYFDIYYKTFNGVVWSSEAQITSDPSPDLHPALAAFDGQLFMEWHSYGYNASSWDIFYATFDGRNWSGAIRLTSNPSVDEGPGSMEVVGGSLYLSFSSSRDGDKEIYYDILNGGHWSGEVRLTNGSAMDWHSSLTDFNNNLYAFYDSANAGTSEIYYKVLALSAVPTPTVPPSLGPNASSTAYDAFSVVSNSTVTSLAFNSSSQEISFKVKGPTNTTGYVAINVSKSILSDVSGLIVYLDSSPVNYTLSQTDDSWLIYLTYHHSEHTIVLSFNQLQSVLFVEPTVTTFVICVAVVLLGVAFLAIIYRVRVNREGW
jgi:Periplasmic component of the Tol biopolymer transport system